LLASVAPVVVYWGYNHLEDDMNIVAYYLEGFYLAELAYSYGYGLACFLVSKHALVTPGMFSLDSDPNCFGTMTRKQAREYTDLSEKVTAFNSYW